MTTPVSTERTLIFENREARIEPTRIPKGSLSKDLGQGGDVYVAVQGSYSPPVDTSLKAVDPVTGLERWSARLLADIVGAPVPSADGRTVWVPGEAVLAAYDAETGAPQGTWGPGTRDVVRPVPLHDDLAVVSNWKNLSVAALEPGRKEPLWETEVGVSHGEPATAPGRVYASVSRGWDEGGSVQALDASTGEPVWRYDAASPIYVSPAAGPDGTVFVSEQDGDVVALDPRTGEPVWKARTEGRPTQAVVSTDGEHVFVGDTGGIQALDADTGLQEWRIQTQPVRLAPGLADDGTLCVATENRQVVLVDAERGLLTAKLDLDGIPGASPLPQEDGSFLVWSLAGQTQRVSTPTPQPPEVPGEIRVEERAITIGDVTLPRL